ncbi:MAG TPA: RNA methyltransferase [Candidatus Eisenbacteria bacterium]|nr:RNA methyltransferase [Candidatus Eisenbacteria bacterium]
MSVLRVRSLDDPRLADYRDIKDGMLRERSAAFAAESREVVRRLLRERRFRARSVLATERALAALADVLDDSVTVFVAPNDVIRDVVGLNFHRGCMAIGERGRPLGLVEALAGAPRRIVVCERLSNPDNVGGIFRDAMAFGAGAVVLSPGCADPLSRKVIRVSIGGALTVPFAEVGDWPATLGRLRDLGYAIVALTTRGGSDVATLAAPSRAALLVGSEGHGLTDDALARADLRATIPMAAGVDSLNAVVACGIALHRLGSAS